MTDPTVHVFTLYVYGRGLHFWLHIKWITELIATLKCCYIHFTSCCIYTKLNDFSAWFVVNFGVFASLELDFRSQSSLDSPEFRLQYCKMIYVYLQYCKMIMLLDIICVFISSFLSALFTNAWEKLLNYAEFDRVVITVLFLIVFLCCLCKIIYCKYSVNEKKFWFWTSLKTLMWYSECITHNLDLIFSYKGI